MSSMNQVAFSPYFLADGGMHRHKMDRELVTIIVGSHSSMTVQMSTLLISLGPGLS